MAAREWLAQQALAEYIRAKGIISQEELIAHVRADGPRHNLPSRPEEPDRPIWSTDIYIDPANLEITNDGKKRKLSAAVFMDLYLLASHEGRNITHEQLLRNAGWAVLPDSPSEITKIRISRLRQALHDYRIEKEWTSPFRYIQNVRNIGYCWDPHGIFVPESSS